MCCQRDACRWRICAGCGRERRLAHGAGVMVRHNRRDPTAWQMVACEGSGQPPHTSPAEPSEASFARFAPKTGASVTSVRRVVPG